MESWLDIMHLTNPNEKGNMSCNPLLGAQPMTQPEKDVLTGIVQHLENLMVQTDALERALIARSLIADGEAGSYRLSYVAAAQRDLALIRQAIAYLPIR
jgi:hypothetical protein